MNYVKKLSKNKWEYLLLILLLISVFVTLMIFQIRNSKKLIFLTSLKNYSLVLDEEDFNVNIKCSRNDTMYFNQKMIKNAYFYDQKTKDTYLVKVKDINLEKDYYQYQYDQYYDYDLTISIPFTSNEVIKFKNFFLVLEYLNDEKLNFKMGTLALLTKPSSQNEIIINSLKGIVNVANQKETVVGIILKMSSLHDEIILNKVEIISSVVNANMNEIKELKNCPDQTEEISKILQKEYDIFKRVNDTTTEILINNEKTLVVPFSYDFVSQVKTLGFILHYQINSESFEQIIYPFKFFETTNFSQIEKMSYDYH